MPTQKWVGIFFAKNKVKNNCTSAENFLFEMS